ncbi:MAG: hypothetical protein HY906_17400 [Deltaproteobacteria bacterium]|nr:hypothetical protein [Deltaproteobacteria bacterium]
MHSSLVAQPRQAPLASQMGVTAEPPTGHEVGVQMQAVPLQLGVVPLQTAQPAPQCAASLATQLPPQQWRLAEHEAPSPATVG